MAHQVQDIAWTTLTDQFRFAVKAKDFDGITNLVPCQQYGETAKIDEFIRRFSDMIQTAVSAARSRLESSFNPDLSRQRPLLIENDDQEMRRSIKYIQQLGDSSNKYDHPMRYSYDQSYIWKLVHEVDAWEPFLRKRGDAIVEPPLHCVKMMLAHGCMEPLYRLCHYKYPLGGIYIWAATMVDEDGWREVMLSALFPFIALNMLRWKMASNRDPTVDYRSTNVYQRALIQAVWRSYMDVHKQKHRVFFGIPRRSLQRGKYFVDGEFTYQHGRVPVGSLPGLEPGVLLKYPSVRKSIEAVHQSLGQRLVPPEMIEKILYEADMQDVDSILEVPYHPLHPDNAEELEKYLGYCWDTLVHCGVLAEWCGKSIVWTEEVNACILLLCFSHISDNKVNIYNHGFRLHDWREDNDQQDGNVLEYMKLRLREQYRK